jgi:hypothetical protein
MTSTSGTNSRTPAGQNVPQQSVDWSRREQSSAPVEMHAERLVREAGSAERAKDAVEAAAKGLTQETDNRQQLAQQLGFATYPELAAASTALVIPGDHRWWVTQWGDGWKAWNAEGTVLSEVFPSLEDARRQIVTS